MRLVQGRKGVKCAGDEAGDVARADDNGLGSDVRSIFLTDAHNDYR